MALEQYVDARQLTRTRVTDAQPAPVLCRFVHRTGGGKRSREEAISQFHPIVRFVGDELRRGDTEFRPAAAARVDAHVAGVPPGTYLVAASFWSVGGLQPVDRLAFAGAQMVDGVWEAVNDEVVERVALTASQHGHDWADVRHWVDLDDAFEAAESAFGQLTKRSETFVAEMTAKNEDRADIQERNLRKHLEQQRASLQLTLDEQRRAKSRIASATAGRITKLESRVERELLKIAKRRTIESSQDEILVTLILVEGKNGR